MNLLEILAETITITLLIFALMIIVEIIELKFAGWMKRFFIENKSLKYILSSLMGSIPGCTGTFFMDTLYIAGIAGFGGIVATMIATMGDETFYIISLAVRSDNAISLLFIAELFGILFILGIIGGWLADVIVKKFRITVCKKCRIDRHEDIDTKKMDWGHFIKEHIWSHIFKKHVVKIFFWILGGLILIEILSEAYEMQASIAENKALFLILAGIIGIIPLSGPNIVIVTFFADGLIPFSILLTNAVVQDGHGLLPLLGFSLEDSFKIKLFNLVFGLAVGFLVMAAGY
ncbi:hypothetical protein AMJ80_01850 [bacterium SM23_31]|nr:MAG: hypothetical protein AMJ80_01850 [bacterium SM23_31]